MSAEETNGFALAGHSDLGGSGDGMQLMRAGDVLYVGHFGPSGMGTSILDVSDHTSPRLVRQWRAPANSHTHKVQVADGLLLTNHERFRSDEKWSAGMAVYDLADPFDPKQIGFWESTGRGVHRIVYEGGRYAYLSATPDGFTDRIWMIVDLLDPEHPTEVGRWWWPGQWTAGGETPGWPEGEDWNTHHAMVAGDRAYVGFWDGGLVILDLTELSEPTVVSHLNWDEGGETHTCLPLPGRDLLVITDEATTDGCDGPPHMVRVVDISDERQPKVVAICPEPEGDFCDRGLRFGAHCLHENRPGSYRSEELMFATYFNAGLRVYDLAEPTAPVEIASYIPACPPGQQAIQINDVWVGEDHLVYITDRVTGGIYILEPDEKLAARMTEAVLR
ncbi:MAG: LVIVD repeat-containing protein [Acidimicrobiia bacterium]